MNQLISFEGGIVFPCMDIPDCIYPFISCFHISTFITNGHVNISCMYVCVFSTLGFVPECDCWVILHLVLSVEIQMRIGLSRTSSI